MPLGDTVKFINTLLRDRGIEHFYMGGLAASAHGEPRSTKDADIIVLVPVEQAEDLLKMVEEAGLHIWNRRRVLEKLTAGRTAKINWDRKYSFDLRVASYTLDEYALDRAQDIYVEPYNQTLRMATPEDLIVYKLARFDQQDHIDIKAVIAVQDSLDWDYMEARVAELSVEANRPTLHDAFVTAKSWATSS